MWFILRNSAFLHCFGLTVSEILKIKDLIKCNLRRNFQRDNRWVNITLELIHYNSLCQITFILKVNLDWVLKIFENLLSPVSSSSLYAFSWISSSNYFKERCKGSLFIHYLSWRMKCKSFCSLAFYKQAQIKPIIPSRNGNWNLLKLYLLFQV